MSVSSRFLRVALLVLPIFVARTALGQAGSGGGVSDNSGGVTVSFVASDTQFANLSNYDCTHSQQFDFQFAYTWASGQVGEFVLSTSGDCDTPTGASFQGSTTCSTDTTGHCPSILLQNDTTLASDPSDGMTTDYGSIVLSSTPPLTTGGIWAAYTELSANTSVNPLPYSTTDATNSTECGPPGGVDNALLYICALINAGSDGIETVVPYGSLSIALNSTVPAAPGRPIVTPLDSALDVSWGPVASASYYYVYVQRAPPTADGGDDANAGDAGVDADAVAIVVIMSATSATVFGLQNGTTYNVYVVSADDSGSNPPTTSNLSGPSPLASGTPYEGKSKAETGCASGGSGGLIAGVVPLVALAALRRRRAGTGGGQRRAIQVVKEGPIARKILERLGLSTRVLPPVHGGTD